MPNRIIKESICTSDSVDALSLEAERLFYRLIVNCDDYGTLDARLKIIKSKCFPLKSSDITDDQLKSWLAEIEKQEIIYFYENEGRQYLKMTSWERQQQIRAKRRKYPSPDDENSNRISSDIIGNQVITLAPVIQSNPIQSNPNPIQSFIGGKPPHTKFVSPTLEEVKAYCTERGKGADPQKWIDHYIANGWMVGKTKMKDWKAAVRTWEKDEKDKPKKADYSDPDRYKNAESEDNPFG